VLPYGRQPVVESPVFPEREFLDQEDPAQYIECLIFPDIESNRFIFSAQ
jgi:hypothetical protein